LALFSSAPLLQSKDGNGEQPAKRPAQSEGDLRHVTPSAPQNFATAPAPCVHRRGIPELLVPGLILTMLIGVAFGVEPESQSPPAISPASAPKLLPLLLDQEGRAITSGRDWVARRASLKEQWERFLGELPKTKPLLNAQLGPTEELEDFSRQYVKYQIEAGLFTDGYLLTPAGRKGRLPAIIVFHPTTPYQSRGVAGLEKDYAEEKWHGVQLVRRGYVVWCPRNYINTEGTDWEGNARRVLARHTNWTGMTRMVWDAIRAADFLETLPAVDRGRIGCIGHSLGGKEALFAMAFDDRYTAGVSSEGGIGLKSSNWDALWYLGPKINQPDFSLENHQVLALIAPRAFLLLAGDSADTESSRAFIEAARPVYDLLGAADNLGWLDHHLGHRYPPQARAAAEAFLDRHLKLRGKLSP
jgi:dienelactone hydrolase